MKPETQTQKYEFPIVETQVPSFKHGSEKQETDVSQNGPIYPCGQMHTAWLFAFTVQNPLKQLML